VGPTGHAAALLLAELAASAKKRGHLAGAMRARNLGARTTRRVSEAPVHLQYFAHDRFILEDGLR